MTNTLNNSRKQLNKRQLELIESLASGLEIPQALAKCRLSETMLRKWTSSPEFVSELTYRQQLAGQQSELLIGRFAPVAASRLISLLESEKEETVRKACLDILQLAAKQSKNETPSDIKPARITFSNETAEKMLKLLAKEGQQISKSS